MFIEGLCGVYDWRGVHRLLYDRSGSGQHRERRAGGRLRQPSAPGSSLWNRRHPAHGAYDRPAHMDTRQEACRVLLYGGRLGRV